MTGRFKCILFDLDGTIASTGGAGIRALEGAFSELFGLDRALKGIDPAGKTDPAIIREIFQVRMGRDCTFNEMLSVQQGYLSRVEAECDRATDYRVMEGIPELLKRLKDLNIVMGLGTGNIELGARHKLKRSGLNPYFPFGGFGSDAEDRAELLRIGHKKACSHANFEITPENVFIVGDTPRDIAAARKANFKVIAAATGGSSVGELNAHSPDYLLSDFKNTEEFVKIILNGDSGRN